MMLRFTKKVHGCVMKIWCDLGGQNCTARDLICAGLEYGF